VSNETAMPYRTLGRTGEKVSLVGLGGFHIGLVPDEQEALGIVRAAIDNGINFMDNCWDYHEGRSEIRMGKALKDGYREKAFLMSKIDGQSKRAAAEQIDESLRRLQVDYVDLMQFHEIIRPEDPERIFAPGGAFEAMMEAKEKGKVRYIGFTGHKDPDIHLKMLETGFARGFTFDAVQMPLNVMDAHYRSFEKKVLPVLLKHNIGVLGMKTVGGYTILLSRLVQPLECIQYVMNLPVSVVITGCDSMERLEQSLTAARTFRPLSQEEVDSILARTAKPASRGRYEIFKSTNVHDGTMFNPHWLGLEA
jgi:predicted aldo/keto reductase-like oxidoreductase